MATIHVMRRRASSALLSVLIALAVFGAPATFAVFSQTVRAPLRVMPAMESALVAAPALDFQASRAAQNTAVTRRVFGLGTSEILVIIGAAMLVLGPDALKGFAKEAGKAAGDLKEVPKAFQEGMDETDAEKATQDVQVVKKDEDKKA
eukprot:TRINITY_DN2264_c0_g1_i1.p1 TRINITY_DN2264_c0_g1~~TRINITY_DN2264_c0_g1_i1.p1  ORF type:complete len:167 (+),score=48.92 TRINITY_DN2264_c0_g1_i1:58-501(+)